MATKYTVGDTTPDVEAFLSDAAGLKDLTGTTIVFKMKGKKTFTRVTGSATPDPDQMTNKGRVTYPPTPTDFNVPDTYVTEFYVVYANGKDQTFVGTDLIVRAQSTAP